MSDKYKITGLVLFGLAVALAGWMFRYDTKPQGPLSLVTDRWTGSVYVCGLYENGEQTCKRQF